VARRALRVQDLKHPERSKPSCANCWSCTTPNCRASWARSRSTAAHASTVHEGGRAAQAPDGRRGLPLHKAHLAGRQPAVRRRAGHAAGHRPRHLPVRDLQQLRGRQRAAGSGVGPGHAALRAGHHQGLHHAGGQRAVPDRTADMDAGHGGPPPVHRRARSAARHRPRAPLRLAGRGALKRSIIINGISGLCITKLDVLDGLPEIKVCVGYRLAAATLDILPLDADEIARLRAGLRDPAGLDRDHRGADQLGASCRPMRGATWNACRR
jgi:adenylosuccinate synthase